MTFRMWSKPQSPLTEEESEIHRRKEFEEFSKHLAPIIRMKWDAWRMGLETGDVTNTLRFVIPHLPPHTDMTSVRVAPGMSIVITVNISECTQ